MTTAPERMRAALACAVALSGFAATGDVAAQRTLDPRNEAHVFVEPLALGGQYIRNLRPDWFAGVTLNAGPLFGVTLRSAGVDDVRSWAGAWAVLGYRVKNGVRIHVAPVGAALAVGNDFSAVYPSGQAGLDIGPGRIRVGSALRVIRVAGPNGTGTWWTQWVPVRLSYVFR